MNIVMMLKNEKTSTPNCCCEDMEAALKDNEHPIYYSSAYNEFGLQLSRKFEYSIINYCIWCGIELPPSRRDEWFEALDQQNIDP